MIDDSDDSDETGSVLRGVAAAPARLPPRLDIKSSATAPFAAGIAAGVLLLERYEISRELGRGGMGRVFAARDRRLGRDVALKILVGEPTDAHAFARVEREARAASRINHPNIATVHDVLATDRGPCIVSELLEGATLRDELATSGALSVDETRKMGAQLAAGLRAAHERGVLHRDLKPANLFVTTDGRLKILDFGLAKLDEPHSAAPRTDEGAVLGTSGYMSPEQVRGQRADARSDLFSAGIVLYEMLMGRRPFEGASRYEIDSRIVEAPPPPLRTDIPADLAATVLRCLEKDPSRRFQSARELTAALDGSAPSTRGPAAHRRARRARVGSAVLAAVVASAAGVAWFAKSRPSATGPAAPPSVAVLPFRDLSPNKDQQYLSDGLAEEILTSLARLDGLRVAGRTSSFSFRDTADDARTIGQKLGVGVLLEGSVRRTGERVRIAARLVNAADGYQLWAQDFDRGPGDLLAVEDEVAREIVGTLRIRLGAGEHPSANHASRDPKAYEEYLLAKRQSDGAAEAARNSIERALARDPQFAAAWAEYAQILFSLAFGDADRPTSAAFMRRAAEAANKAIELDPQLTDGYVIRSAIRSDGGTWDLRGAVADLERASALSPNDTATLGLKAHQLLYFSRRIDEAIALYQRVTQLDPLNGSAWMFLAYGYREARRFAEERAALTRASEINPQDPLVQVFLAELELHDGQLDKALARWDAIPGYPFRLPGRAWVLDRMHRRAESRIALAELEAKGREDNPYFVGHAYAVLGDLDRAFQYFETALQRGDVAVVDIAASPWLDNVRRDPRYQAIARKLGVFEDTVAPAPSIAVLPFRDLSPNKDQQYLSDGIAEEILTSLARVDGLHVAGRTSSFSLRDTTDDARTIGQKLGVRALLEGSVQRLGERVRISARLVNAADGYHIWAQDFDRGTADILTVEDELARDIVAALKVKLVAGEHALPANRGSRDPQAYADFLLARRQADRESYEGLVEARRSIERALKHDPKFAAAWVEYAKILGHIIGSEKTNRAAATVLAREAREAADKAIALDPDLPEAWLVRGRAKASGGGWDSQGMRANVEHALALGPNNPEALVAKAQLLLWFSNHVDEGIAAAKRATELDPLDGSAWDMLGFGYRRDRRFAEAKAAYTRSVEISSADGFARASLAELEFHEGHLETALDMFNAVPETYRPLRYVGRATVLQALHRPEEARAAVAELISREGGEEVPASVGCAYVAIGDLDRAFFYFDKALAYGDAALADVMASPWTESLHGSPRYEAFLRKMKLLDAN